MLLLEIIVLVEVNDVSSAVWVVLEGFQKIFGDFVVFYGFAVTLTDCAVTDIPFVPPCNTILCQLFKVV